MALEDTLIVKRAVALSPSLFYQYHAAAVFSSDETDGSSLFCSPFHIQVVGAWFGCNEKRSLCFVD